MEGELSCAIDSFVGEYNHDREWVTRVLTYEQDTEIRCRWAKEEGIEEGREEGMDRMSALVGRLIGGGRVEDAARAASDPAYRDALLKELGL